MKKEPILGCYNQSDGKFFIPEAVKPYIPPIKRFPILVTNSLSPWDKLKMEQLRNYTVNFQAARLLSDPQYHPVYILPQ